MRYTDPTGEFIPAVVWGGRAAIACLLNPASRAAAGAAVGWYTDEDDGYSIAEGMVVFIGRPLFSTDVTGVKGWEASYLPFVGGKTGGVDGGGRSGHWTSVWSKEGGKRTRLLGRKIARRALYVGTLFILPDLYRSRRCFFA